MGSGWWTEHSLLRGRFFRSYGACPLWGPTTHDLRRGLHSFAASRLASGLRSETTDRRAEQKNQDRLRHLPKPRFYACLPLLVLIQTTFARIRNIVEITDHSHKGVFGGTINIDTAIPTKKEAFISNNHFHVAMNYLFRVRAQARIPAAARAATPLAARFIEA